MPVCLVLVEGVLTTASVLFARMVSLPTVHLCVRTATVVVLLAVEIRITSVLVVRRTMDLKTTSVLNVPTALLLTECMSVDNVTLLTAWPAVKKMSARLVSSTTTSSTTPSAAIFAT